MNIKRRRSIQRRSSREPFIKPGQAWECMITGSWLIRTHGQGRCRKWSVVPGGAVDDATAEKLVNHPAVVGQADGLFPGCNQTWRMQAPAQAAAATSSSIRWGGR
jgi:hypothetical protein